MTPTRVVLWSGVVLTVQPGSRQTALAPSPVLLAGVYCSVTYPNRAGRQECMNAVLPVIGMVFPSWFMICRSLWKSVGVELSESFAEGFVEAFYLTGTDDDRHKATRALVQ